MSVVAVSVAVLTTMRSRISPGILLESNTSWASGIARMVLNCGFQVTTAVLAAVAKAPTTAESPQPSASIQLTRMPRTRL